MQRSNPLTLIDVCARITPYSSCAVDEDGVINGVVSEVAQLPPGALVKCRKPDAVIKHVINQQRC